MEGPLSQLGSHLGKVFIVCGIFFIVVGLWLLFAKDLPLLNLLGKLPGDIRIEKKGFSFFFPLTTCLLISALLTALSWIARWLLK